MGQVANGGAIGPIVALAILLIGFLIFRFIVLWYWRVNEVISLLKSIDEKLGRIAFREPTV